MSELDESSILLPPYSIEDLSLIDCLKMFLNLKLRRKYQVVLIESSLRLLIGNRPLDGVLSDIEIGLQVLVVINIYAIIFLGLIRMDLPGLYHGSVNI